MRSVSFGEFVLDLATRELRRAGNTIALSPKAYQLLELLVVSRPQALSKSALQERLWPDTFVLEKNLVNLIAEIRDALGDNAAHPHFVRTVRRFGYAFRDATSQGPASRPPAGKWDVRFRVTWPGGHVGLTEGEHVLGRDPDLELFLDSPDVSRRHARIRVVGADATIEDLDSKNGTFVAGRRIRAACSLADGDAIRLGSTELTFTSVTSRGSTETRQSR